MSQNEQRLLLHGLKGHVIAQPSSCLCPSPSGWASDLLTLLPATHPTLAVPKAPSISACLYTFYFHDHCLLTRMVPPAPAQSHGHYWCHHCLLSLFPLVRFCWDHALDTSAVCCSFSSHYSWLRLFHQSPGSKPSHSCTGSSEKRSHAPCGPQRRFLSLTHNCIPAPREEDWVNWIRTWERSGGEERLAFLALKAAQAYGHQRGKVRGGG